MLWIGGFLGCSYEYCHLLGWFTQGLHGAISQKMATFKDNDADDMVLFAEHKAY
jgi:hypothetical protein